MPKRSFQALLLAVGLLVANIGRARTIVFQEETPLPAGGLYAGTQDTEIQAVDSSTSFGTKISVRTDLDYLGAETQGLLRFDGLFGALPNQIPPGSTITSAVLTLEVFNSSNVPVGIISVYQMTTPWSESSTWNSLVGGVQVGNETVAVADDAHTTELIASTTFDVLPSLQAWAAGADNFGWVFLNSNTDGTEFWSSEIATVAVRPKLAVTFVPPATPPAVPALTRYGLVALLVGLTLVGSVAIRSSMRRRDAPRVPSTPS